jgi:hypothetical protein
MPGVYPKNLSTDQAEQKRQLAKHKLKQIEYETCTGVKAGLRAIISQIVQSDHLVEINDSYSGIGHLT